MKKSCKPGVSKVFARRATFGKTNICGAAFDYNTGCWLYSIHFMNQATGGRSKFDQGPHLARRPDFGHACCKPNCPCFISWIKLDFFIACFSINMSIIKRLIGVQHMLPHRSLGQRTSSASIYKINLKSY